MPAATAVPAPAGAFVRVRHSAQLHQRTLAVLEALEQADDPMEHSEALANLIVDLTSNAFEYCFMQPLRLTKPGFFLERTASLGLAAVHQIIGPVIHQVIEHMEASDIVRLADQLVAGMASYSPGAVIYFAIDEMTPRLAEHRAAGGAAAGQPDLEDEEEKARRLARQAAGGGPQLAVSGPIVLEAPQSPMGAGGDGGAPNASPQVVATATTSGRQNQDGGAPRGGPRPRIT